MFKAGIFVGIALTIAAEAFVVWLATLGEEKETYKSDDLNGY